MNRYLVVLLAAVGMTIVCLAQENPRERFWEAAPVAGPHTIFIWQFDGKAEISDDAVIDLMEAGLGDEPPTAPGGLALPTAGKAAFVLHDGAQLVAEGRFGGGLHLPAEGWLEATGIPLPGLLQAGKPMFIELWVKPDKLPERAAKVLAIPAGQAELAVVVDAEGALSLTLAGEKLLTHPRGLTAGGWRHVGLLIDREAALYVDGTPAAAGSPKIAAFRRAAGPTFHCGQGLAATIDALQLRGHPPMLYEKLDWPFVDVARERPLLDGPPNFAKAGPYKVRASFDGSVEPEVLEAFGFAGQAPASAFAPGVRGQALDLRPAGDATFAVKGFSALPHEQGAIVFWFRPLDWDNLKMGGYVGEGVKWLPLLTLNTAETPHYLAYRAVSIYMGRAARDASKPWVQITPGTWIHVAITWLGAKTTVYLNGEPQTITQVSYRREPHPAHRGPYDQWHARTGGKDDGSYRLAFMPSGTLVDELSIYDRSLSPAEIWNAYVRYYPDAAERLRPLPYVDAGCQYIAHSWSMVPRLRVALTALPTSTANPASMTLVLRDAAGQTLYTSDRIALDEAGRATIEVERQIDFGTYSLLLSSFGPDGQKLKEGQVIYERVKPPWYGNALGKDHSVPPPWTPVGVTDNVLSVWGRSLHLSQSGLPASIEAVGRKLLAAPVTMWGRTVDGEMVSMSPRELTIGERHGDRVEWQGKLAGTLVNATVDGWLEFDGLSYYTVTLTPAGDQPVQLASLAVDVPMLAAEVSQVIANGAGQNFRASWDIRMIPAGEGRVWDTLTSKPQMERGVTSGNWCPNIWVGGDTCGLNIFGENDQGWTPSDTVPAQELIRASPALVTYRMNVISSPVDLNGPRTFTFTLLPTPTKPEPAGWRGWNRAPAEVPLSQYDVIDKFNGFSLSAPAGSMGALEDFTVEPHSWEDAAFQAAAAREKFGAHNPLQMYMDYSWPKPGPSFADWNHDLWAGAGRIAWIPELEDYFVWLIEEYRRRGLIDGLYIDDVSFGRTYSLALTGYLAPGEKNGRRLGMSTLGFRRFLMRSWRLFAANGQLPHFTAHMTYCFELPALSFCMAAVNGEAREMHPFDKRDTIATWSQDELRIMGNAAKWGFATFWKPTIQKTELATDPKMLAHWLHGQSRAMHATMVAHDLWYLWHYPSGRSILPSFTAFGLHEPDLVHLPYWLNGELASAATVSGKPVLVTLFKRTDKALLMISNLNGEDQEVTLTLDATALFGRPVNGVAWTDVDCSLLPPEGSTPVEDAPAAPAGGMDEEDPLGGVPLDDVLSGETPREKETKRLALRLEGAKAAFLVRRHDYRLLEARPK